MDISKNFSAHDSVYSSSASFLTSDDDEMSELSQIYQMELEDSQNNDNHFNYPETPEIKIEMDPLEQKSAQNTSRISELLFSEIKDKSFDCKKSARKCLDMDSFIPKMNSSISSLITTPERICLGNISNNNNILPRPFLKRIDPPETISPTKSAKKIKCEEKSKLPTVNASLSTQSHLQLQPKKKPVFRKSISVDEAALLFNDKNMTADFCYELSLPILAKSKHSDLKSISPETMRQLLNGEFNDRIASYKIIDCRYPYEFDGGHIRGAKNLYMENQIYDEFMTQDTPHVDNNGKRNIIIFHCEFSSERGPRQYRLLRSLDRAAHAYPALQYPEIYLLEGGYKAFFECYQDCCEPKNYRLMVDPHFSAQYQDYRAKTKRSRNGVDETGSKLRMKSKTRSRLAL